MDNSSENKSRAQKVAEAVAELIGYNVPVKSITVHDQEPVSEAWPVAIVSQLGSKKNLLVHLGERWVWICLYGFFGFKWNDDRVEIQEAKKLAANLPNRPK